MSDVDYTSLLGPCTSTFWFWRWVMIMSQVLEQDLAEEPRPMVASIAEDILNQIWLVYEYTHLSAECVDIAVFP